MAADLFALLMHCTENLINVMYDFEAFGQNFSHFRLTFKTHFGKEISGLLFFFFYIDLKTFQPVVYKF